VILPMEQNLILLRRAHKSLPQGGRVLIFNSISGDDGRGPLMAALDTAYFMAIPYNGGAIHSWNDYRECLNHAGFQHIDCIPCDGWTPHGLIVATK
jgi:hypothetical protein